MSFVFVLVILGFVFMVSSVSKAVQRYYAKSQDEEEEENVADTVKFLLGTPASDEDRQAVNEFTNLIKIFAATHVI